MSNPPPRLLFCGDVHQRFESVLYAARAYRPAAMILLGDLQPSVPLSEVLAGIQPFTDVYFIHGNHDTDTDDYYRRVFESGVSHLNLHGRIVEIAGYRVAGLGGIFRGKVWRPPEPPRFRDPESYRQALHPRQPISTVHHSSIWPEDYEALRRAGTADILVTHEAPSCHPHGFTAIDDLARALGVKKAFHGHHHDRLDYSERWATLGFEAYGVGLRGISDLEGNVVVPGQLDAERSQRQVR